MSRIEEKFAQLRRSGRRALMPFLTAGDPDLATTRELVLEIERAGADILELGIPFSDPIADGPTIQQSSQRALQAGTTPEKVLELVAELRQVTELPIVLMTYYNLVFRFGEAELARRISLLPGSLMSYYNLAVRYGDTEFVRQAVEAGADGLIIPDLPPDEAQSVLSAGEKYGLDIIFLLAPTSTPERIQLVSQLSSGFIYYVSLTGITGARDKLAQDIGQKVRQIAAASSKPVAVGFGISNPEQAGQVARWADGVIVGSALINIIASGNEVEKPAYSGKMLRSLREADLDGMIHRAVEEVSKSNMLLRVGRFIRSLREGIDAATLGMKAEAEREEVTPRGEGSSER